jgi:outer membrane lipoprotein SlyB
MLGIGSQDYQYSFLERMGGMSEAQLRKTFDVFGASVEGLAFGNNNVENISKLSSNVTSLMQGLGIDADFEHETKIKMADLDKGIKTAIENIVSGKDINAAVAGTVLGNLVGGAGRGAALGGFGGPTGALVGSILGGILGLVRGISTAAKEAKNKKESNKRIELMIQQQYSKMLDQLTLYMQQRAQEAEQKFEKSIRRF